MRVLIFSPYGEKNGAEVMLNEIAGEGITDPALSVMFFFRQRGKLIKEVKAPYYLAKINNSFLLRGLNIIFKLLGFRSYQEREILRVHRAFKPDLWYLNTIHMSEVGLLANEINQPFIVHYHDMLFQYERIGYSDLELLVKFAKRNFACSKIVADRLEEIGAQNVRIQYECISDRVLKKGDVKSKRVLDIPDESFVWVMSGSINMRKGVDYFLELSRLNPQDFFIWLGDSQTGLKFYVEQSIKINKLKNIRFVGFMEEDYYSYLSVMDSFLLTSREDPFPLVMIEAACLGKPIVSFPSGGVEEFIVDGMGKVVNYFSIEQLNNAMNELKAGGLKFNRKVAVKRGMEFLAKSQYKSWKNNLLN